MLDETPLLDIKPYIPDFDVHETKKTGWIENKTDKLSGIKSDIFICRLHFANNYLLDKFLGRTLLAIDKKQLESGSIRFYGVGTCILLPRQVFAKK